jgi:ABC-type Mn2+/Zn2+ transport system permease subunit
VTSVAIGVGASVAGLAASRVWGLAPGGTIVLVSTAVFVMIAAFARSVRRGAIAEGSDG